MLSKNTTGTERRNRANHTWCTWFWLATRWFSAERSRKKNWSTLRRKQMPPVNATFNLCYWSRFRVCLKRRCLGVRCGAELFVSTTEAARDHGLFEKFCSRTSRMEPYDNETLLCFSFWYHHCRCGRKRLRFLPVCSWQKLARVPVCPAQALGVPPTATDYLILNVVACNQNRTDDWRDQSGLPKVSDDIRWKSKKIMEHGAVLYHDETKVHQELFNTQPISDFQRVLFMYFANW